MPDGRKINRFVCGHRLKSIASVNKATKLHLKNINIRTCLAATLDVPTTFPLSSSTLTPSDSSECLMSTTLQTFALAAETREGVRKNQSVWPLGILLFYLQFHKLYFQSPSLRSGSLCGAIGAGMGSVPCSRALWKMLWGWMITERPTEPSDGLTWKVIINWRGFTGNLLLENAFRFQVLHFLLIYYSGDHDKMFRCRTNCPHCMLSSRWINNSGDPSSSNFTQHVGLWPNSCTTDGFSGN